jgi:hypothetical protein
MPGFNPANVLNGRKICRTVRDALDQLGLTNKRGIVATIYAGEIFCPNGDTPGLVLIGTGSTGDRDRRYLRMPDSNTFRGRFADGTPIQGAINELDRATVKSDGVVVLPDGRKIRSVEFQPGARFPNYDLTPRQEFLVHLAIDLLGAADNCYRAIDEKLLPGVRLLDYSAIQGICVLRVKKLVDLVKKSSYARVSRLEIETALRLAGLLSKNGASPRAR